MLGTNEISIEYLYAFVGRASKTPLLLFGSRIGRRLEVALQIRFPHHAGSSLRRLIYGDYQHFGIGQAVYDLAEQAMGIVEPVFATIRQNRASNQLRVLAALQAAEISESYLAVRPAMAMTILAVIGSSRPTPRHLGPRPHYSNSNQFGTGLGTVPLVCCDPEMNCCRQPAPPMTVCWKQLV